MAKSKATSSSKTPHLGYSFARGRMMEAEDVVGPMKPMASHEPTSKVKQHRGMKRPISRKVSR